VRQLPLHRGPLASWTAWTVPKTVRPGEAARLVGMDEAQLREVNRIPPHMLVKAGSTLLVPRGEHRQADVSIEVADNATMALAPDAPAARRMSLKAGRKDTVASIAKRYRVSAALVAQWNGVAKTAGFAPGQTVVLYVAGKGTRTAHQGATGKKATRTAAAPHKVAGKRKTVAASGRVRVAHN
jgi:membrane-bound lytic murein transglycosylase D